MNECFPKVAGYSSNIINDGKPAYTVGTCSGCSHLEEEIRLEVKNFRKELSGLKKDDEDDNKGEGGVLSRPVQKILLITFATLMMVLVSYNIRELANPGISTHNRFVYNKSHKSPAITVCNIHHNKNLTYLNQITNNKSFNSCASGFNWLNCLNDEYNKNVNLTDMANLYFYDLEELYRDCNSGSLEKWNERFTDEFVMERAFSNRNMEPCYTWRFKSGYIKYQASGNPQLCMVIPDARWDGKSQPIPEWELYLHEDHEPFRGQFSKDHAQFPTMTVNGAFDVFVKISLSKYSAVNRNTAPCNQDNDYSPSKCTADLFTKLSLENEECNVPWLEPYRNYPECTNLTTIRRIHNRSEQLRKDDTVAKTHKCIDRCVRRLYEFNSVRKDPQVVKSRFKNGVYHMYSSVEVQFTSAMINEITEKTSYDFVLFVSDFGGLIGLFLGLSLVHVIHPIEQAVDIFKRYIGYKP